MDLLTREVRAAFARFPIGSQERLGDQAKVVVKFFFPAGRYTFYATEGQQEDGDFLLYGYCVSALGADCDEWGYAVMSEFTALNVRGLKMERDLHFTTATRTVRDALGRAA
jgi:hypothetical protein